MADESKEVMGVRCSIDFDLDFEDIAKHFDISVAEVREMWNSELLSEYIGEWLLPSEVLKLSVGMEEPELNLGNGYKQRY